MPFGSSATPAAERAADRERIFGSGAESFDEKPKTPTPVFAGTGSRRRVGEIEDEERVESKLLGEAVGVDGWIGVMSASRTAVTAKAVFVYVLCACACIL